MDEKHALEERDIPMAPPRPARRSRHLVLAIILFVITFTFWPFRPFHQRHLNVEKPDVPSTPGNNVVEIENKLVPLEAHIISKCPDTRDALRELLLPVMERVHDKVNFTLSYIGRPTSDGGVSCKHGPAECMGNILELCARELYPDPKINLGFVMCLTKDFMNIPERALVEDCALEHAIDIKELDDCAVKDDGAHGMHMLRESVDRSAAAGVSISCTIRLNDEVYCIRDGGEWKDCPSGPGVNDLVIAIEKLSRQS